MSPVQRVLPLPTLLITLLTVLLMPATATAVSIPAPTAFSASYSATINGKSLGGHAQRTLKSEGQGQYSLTLKAGALIGNSEESSRFLWQNGTLYPLEYSNQRKVVFRSRRERYAFDWKNKQFSVTRKGATTVYPLMPGTIDALTLDLVIKHDLSQGLKEMNYLLADDDGVSTQRYAVQGEDMLDTPLGKLATLRVKRVREASKRQTTLWFARDYDWLPVKLQQVEPDGSRYEMLITATTVAKSGH